MRVISGKFKGKRLFAPTDNRVRPTTDRIKETIFNILASKCEMDGTTVLDLFCGSGALGIEALSRNAKRAIFIDSSPESIKLTKKNLLEMGKITVKNAATHSRDSLQDSLQNTIGHAGETKNDNIDTECIAEIYNTGFEIALKKLQGTSIDIIFIDPPYFDNLGDKALYLIDKHDILAQNGIIVYEYHGKNSLSIDSKRFIMDTRSFGSVTVSFLTQKTK